ncbi:MAG: PHP domain-containing protein, partial [Deltaproteobacteria bacterium]|nr:PHP domain-containing protein [Deltaproteobacteria bacterium]
RKGHSLTNGHVAALARRFGARLVLDTDTHAPRDLVDREMAVMIAKGAGMSEEEIETMFGNSESLAKEAAGR